MKKLKIILILSLFLIIFIVAKSTPAQKTAVINFITPIAAVSPEDSLKKYNNTLQNTSDLEKDWRPLEDFGTYTQPEISGAGGILVDLATAKVLFSKNPTQRLKIASLTKIMTAVIALEHRRLDDKIYITAQAANIGENVMGVSEGEVYTLEELLYGLILNSGNDAAYAVADAAAGNSTTFVEWMNFKAKELGLTDTYFVDPSGLNDDTYSTALDLVKLTRYAMQKPEFREIVKTVDKEIIGDSHKYIYLQNQTNLLTTYPGVEGVKTGFTQEAGLSLVTAAKNAGKEVIGVVLNSIDRKGDMILMLDHGFNTLGVSISHPELVF